MANSSEYVSTATLVAMTPFTETACWWMNTSAARTRPPAEPLGSGLTGPDVLRVYPGVLCTLLCPADVPLDWGPTAYYCRRDGRWQPVPQTALSVANGSSAAVVVSDEWAALLASDAPATPVVSSSLRAVSGGPPPLGWSGLSSYCLRLGVAGLPTVNISTCGTFAQATWQPVDLYPGLEDAIASSAGPVLTQATTWSVQSEWAGEALRQWDALSLAVTSPVSLYDVAIVVSAGGAGADEDACVASLNERLRGTRAAVVSGTIANRAATGTGIALTMLVDAVFDTAPLLALMAQGANCVPMGTVGAVSAYVLVTTVLTDGVAVSLPNASIAATMTSPAVKLGDIVAGHNTSSDFSTRLTIDSFANMACSFVSLTIGGHNNSLSVPPPLYEGAYVVSDSIPAPVINVTLPLPPAATEQLTTQCYTDYPALVGLEVDTAHFDAASMRAAQLQLSVPFMPFNNVSEWLFVTLTCTTVSAMAPGSGSDGALPAYSPLMTNSLGIAWRRTVWPFVATAVVQYQSGASLTLGTGGVPFLLPTTTAVNATLIGDVSHALLQGGGSFTAAHPVAVFVGGVPCTVQDVSPDGQRMLIRLPHSLCANASGNSSTSTSDESGGDSRGCGSALPLVLSSPTVTLICPPFCPGLLSRPVPVWNGSGPDATVIITAPALQQLPAASFGVVYYTSCTADGFTDPTTGACANASDPASRQCAHGQGDSCETCPRGSLCPSPFLVWPQEGYWSDTAPFSTDVIVCPSPATSRCLGWTGNTTECGTGYILGSGACDACAPSYYPDTTDGSCQSCPTSMDSLWSIARPLLLLLVALAGTIFSVVSLTVITVMLLHPGQQQEDVGYVVTGRLGQLLDYVVWLTTLVQIEVQVSRVTSPGLPVSVHDFYEQVAVFSFSGLIVHPACFGTDAAFRSAIVSFVGALCATFLLVLCTATFPSWFTCVHAASLQIGKGSSEWKTHLRSWVCPRFSRQPPSPSTTPAPVRSKSRVAGAVAVEEVATVFENSLFSRTPALRRAKLKTAVARPASSKLATEEYELVASAPTCRDRLRPVYVLTLMLAMVYPVITNSALGIVSCSKQSMTVGQYRLLNHDGATLRRAGIPIDGPPSTPGMYYADPSRDLIVSVWILIENPYVVCFEAGHTPVAVLAVATLVFYSLLFPAFTFCSVRRMLLDRRGHIAAAREKQPNGTGRVAERGDVVTITVVRSPAERTTTGLLMRRGDAGDDGARLAETTRLSEDYHHAHDNERTIALQKDWAYFVASEYRSSAYWFRHIDWGVLLVLSVLSQVLRRPTTVSEAVGSLVAALFVIVGTLCLLLRYQPYVTESHQLLGKHWCKVTVLVLSVNIAFTHFVSSLVELAAQLQYPWLTSRSTDLSSAAQILSYSCLGLSGLLFLLLAVGFARSLIAPLPVRVSASVDSAEVSCARDAGRMPLKVAEDERAVERNDAVTEQTPTPPQRQPANRLLSQADGGDSGTTIPQQDDASLLSAAEMACTRPEPLQGGAISAERRLIRRMGEYPSAALDDDSSDSVLMAHALLQRGAGGRDSVGWLAMADHRRDALTRHVMQQRVRRGKSAGAGEGTTASKHRGRGKPE